MNNSVRIEKYCEFAQNIANDNSHGYSQVNRWGLDYDCSSFVITALESVGIPVKTHGATYTGNLATALLQSGFNEVYDGTTKRGDIGLTHRSDKQHCAIMLGNGYMVHASGAHGHPETGDQNDNEICIATSSKFDRYFRLTESADVNKISTCNISVTLPVLRLNSVGSAVGLLQYILDDLGFDCKIDYDFGNKTLTRVKEYQKYSKYNLEIDGIVGCCTWSALLGDIVE